MEIHIYKAMFKPVTIVFKKSSLTFKVFKDKLRVYAVYEQFEFCTCIPFVKKEGYWVLI
jgi:hypothetical protein